MTDATYMTGAEVRALLRCDRQTLYVMRRDGRIPFVRLTERRFRYPRVAVLALAEQRTAQSAPDDSGRARRGKRRAA